MSYYWTAAIRSRGRCLAPGLRFAPPAMQIRNRIKAAAPPYVRPPIAHVEMPPLTLGCSSWFVKFASPYMTLAAKLKRRRLILQWKTIQQLLHRIRSRKWREHAFSGRRAVLNRGRLGYLNRGSNLSLRQRKGKRILRVPIQASLALVPEMDLRWTGRAR